MVQLIKLLVAILAQQSAGLSLDCPILTQLPTNVAEKAEEDGPRNWALHTLRQTQMAVLLPGFSLSSLDRYGLLGVSQQMEDLCHMLFK